MKQTMVISTKVKPWAIRDFRMVIRVDILTLLPADKKSGKMAGFGLAQFFLPCD